MKRLLALWMALMLLLTGCGEVIEISDSYGGNYLYEYEEYPEDYGYYGDYGYDEDYGYVEDYDPYPEDDGTSPAYVEAWTQPTEAEIQPTQTTAALIDEYGWYYSAEEVSEYLDTYGCLPENFITKREARELGWEGGSVEVYAPGYAIGGDRFYNYDGNLPDEAGRLYYECDIDTDGKRTRGAKRLVYSNDGLIFYTEDHYETFTLLYGEDEA